jgi:iron complex transport system substrate-binding protein
MKQRNGKIFSAVRIVLIIATISLGMLAFAGYHYRSCYMGKTKNTFRVIDQAGREVYVPDNVDRIVSLWSEATRLIIALGQGNKLVGICDGENEDPIFKKIFPKLAVLPELGDADKEFTSIEGLISLKPDVVFVYVTSVNLANEIQDKTGIPTLCVSLNVPSKQGRLSYDIITVIGKAIHREERAYFLREYLREKLSKIRSISSQIPPAQRKKGIFIDPDMMVVGFRDPVESAGMINVGLNLDRWWYKVNSEQLIAWTPDYIFLGLHISHFKSLKDQYAAIMSDSRWKKVKAVQKRQVYVWIDYCWSWYPALMLIDIMRMAKITYPDRFRHIDVEKEGNEIFKVLYGPTHFYTDLVKRFEPYDIPK